MAYLVFHLFIFGTDCNSFVIVLLVPVLMAI